MVYDLNKRDQSRSRSEGAAADIGGQSASIDVSRTRLSAEQRLAALARLSEAVGGAEDEVEILGEVAEVAAQILSAHMVSVFIYSGAAGLKYVAGFGLSAPLTQRIEEVGSTDLLERFMSGTAQPLVISDVRNDPLTRLIASQASSASIVSLVSAPLRSENKLLGVLVAYDTRERTYTEEDLDSLRLLANLASIAMARLALPETREANQRARAHFFTVVSHELRTPLTSIMGFTQLLRRKVSNLRDADPRLLQQLDMIWAQSQRLNRLIDTFADVSHIERGDFAIKRGTLELGSVLRASAAQALAQLNSTHDVKLEIPDRSLWVRGDEKRLTQVFTHLISNAIYYSPEDEAVSVRAETLPEDQVAVTITDHGPGIPASRLKDIFEPYRQGDPLRAGGLGVGLYISKTIVEAHGGHLSVESSSENGTTLLVVLPV